MATTKTVARFSYTDSLGDSLVKTITSIDPSVTDANLRALSTGMVTYKDVFGRMPAVPTKIEKVTTTTTEVSLA